MGFPLTGYKVIEVSTHVAVPVASRIMADFGADVIKVEPLSGDPWRVGGRLYNLPIENEKNPLFEVSNANKKLLSLDLKSEKGKEIIHELLSDADVFLTNLRGPALKKLGLDKETLMKKYPGLVMGVITGYGMKGDLSNKPGYDMTSFWASTGTVADWSMRGNFPFRPTGGFGDSATASLLLSGILMALLKKERTGVGDFVETSLFGAGIWYNSTGLLAGNKKYANGYPKSAFEATSPISWTYKCKDGEWVMLTLIDYDRYFPIVARLMNLDELIGDEKFKNLESTKKNIVEIIKLFNNSFITKTSDEWVELFTKHDLVHQKLVHLDEVLSSKQAWENGYLEKVVYEDEDSSTVTTPAIKIAGVEERVNDYNLPIGKNSKEILRSLGYDSDQIQKLLDSKIIK